MRRYWIAAGAVVLGMALVAGFTMAALGPGAPGGPPHRQGPGGGGPPPGVTGPGGGGPQQGTQADGQGATVPPPLVGQLEAAVGSPLTEGQRGQIRDAGEALRAAIKAAHDVFVQKLATITGLSVEKVQSMLPPPPPPQGRRGPPPGGEQPQGRPMRPQGGQTPPAPEGNSQ